MLPSRSDRGPSVDTGVMVLSVEDSVLLIELRLEAEAVERVPARDMCRPPVEMRASALSKTLPENAPANDAL